MQAGIGRRSVVAADLAPRDSVAAIESAVSNLTTRIDELLSLKQSGITASHFPGVSAITGGPHTAHEEAEGRIYSTSDAVQEKLEKIVARVTQLEQKIVEIQTADLAERQPSERIAGFFEHNRINRIGSIRSVSPVHTLPSRQRTCTGPLGEGALRAKPRPSTPGIAQRVLDPKSELIGDRAAAPNVWYTGTSSPEPTPINRDFATELCPAHEVQLDDQVRASPNMPISETETYDYPAVLIRAPRVSFRNKKILLTLIAAVMLLIVGTYALSEAMNLVTSSRSTIMSRRVLNDRAEPPVDRANHQADSLSSRSDTVPENLLSQAITGMDDPSHISDAGSEPDISDSIRSSKTMMARVSDSDAELAALRQQAETGNVDAQYELATRYAEGRLMERDFKLSAVWYEKAAMRGLAPAQYRIGSLYEAGVGVTRNLARARSWYEKAASQGHARAMYNLAVLMSEGANGEPDYTTAAIWFRKAAELGVRDSQYNLAILFARGLGVQRDFAQSYTWFAIAAAQGDEEAGKKLEMIAAMLEAKELAQAKAAVSAFRPRETDRNAIEVHNPLGDGMKDALAASATFALPAASMMMTAQSADFPISFGSIDGRSNGVNTHGVVSTNSVPGSDIATCSSVTVWKRFHQFGQVDLTGENAACK
jgi:localization factor PodJL